MLTHPVVVKRSKSFSEKSKYFAQIMYFCRMSSLYSKITNLGQRINRGSYMSAHVLLNLLNELGKRDKMRGLPSILSLFRNEFNKFNNS